jgi:hypothetical protein
MVRRKTTICFFELVSHLKRKTGLDFVQLNVFLWSSIALLLRCYQLFLTLDFTIDFKIDFTIVFVCMYATLD